MNRARLFIIIIISFQILSFLIYGQTLKYPGFLGDDYYAMHEILREEFSFSRVWFNRFGSCLPYYRPFTHYTYRINFLLGRLNPYSYHFVNIVLQGLNCSLIFFMVYFLLKGSIFISLCPALFFMVHPVNSVTTTWITGRLELFCCFFMLLAIMNYYCFLNTSQSRKRIYFAFALFSSFLAFSSKEHALTLPMLVLVADIWYSPRCPVKDRVKRVLPFFIVLGLHIALRCMVLKNTSWVTGGYSLLDYRHVLENILRAIKLGLFPIQAIMNRTVYIYSLLFFLISISILPLLFKDKKIIFSLLWFFVTFGSMYKFYAFPTTNIYIQTIAFCLFIPFITEFYAKLFFQNKKALKTLTLTGIVLLLLSMYTVMTIKRNTYAQMAYKTSDSFIKGVLKLYPHYPEGSTFYFVNIPYLVGENQIYGHSELVDLALSLNYGLYYKRIPVYGFTFMSDTLKAENKIEVEIKDTKTLIVSSTEVYLNHWDFEPGTEHALVEEIDCPNMADRDGAVTARKVRITLKERAIKCPKKHFFYFSNGIIYELDNFGQ